MSDSKTSLPVDRLASLARAAHEARRFAAPDREAREQALSAALGALDKKQRKSTGAAVSPFFMKRSAAAPPQRSGGVLGEETTQVAELLKARAGLELKLKTEDQKLSDLQEVFSAELHEHGKAKEVLSLQQRKLKEFQEERSRLLADVSQLESKLRMQVNETEQVQLRFEKLKTTRQTMSDQATDHAEQIATLQTENEKLRIQIEQAKRERDKGVSEAQVAVEEATGETADAVFKELWARMQTVMPDVFSDTHVPTRRTFESLCDSYVEFVRVLANLERHVHQLLKDLRQVGEQSDKLNHFYIMFTKNPGLLPSLKDFLASGKRKGNYLNLLKAQQTWARAFATGTYKVLVRSPLIIGEELNPKSWPIKGSFTVSEEAALGKYYKETACKEIPEKLGTTFRKHAADMAYEDYNDLMKRK